MSMMDRWEQRTKETKKVIKSCGVAQMYESFGFRKVTINRQGDCSGCRNPDDNELEPQCKTCKYNEYGVEV